MDNDRSRTFRIIKIDFLGLRNLSIIHQIVTQVKYDLNVEIDIEAIPFDDPKVFALLSQGETTGIFQLESEGVRHVLQRLKPQHFEDIVAVTSLYRPGPMEEIPTYITRRHEPSKVAYLHPDLESILKVHMVLSFIKSRLCKLLVDLLASVMEKRIY